VRALGARRTTVPTSLLLEAILLALAGGATGVAVATLAIYLFRTLIVGLMGTPLLIPVPLGLAALALALTGVVVAALVPALRISFQDPATSMRE
jgi:ABC-type antimicrobial peptide transport system permease subunit